MLARFARLASDRTQPQICILNDSRPPLRVAYLADQYPRTNETFIHREIAALRAQGVHVETFSVWRPLPSETAEGSERDATFYLRSAPPLRILAVHLGLLAGSPLRYFRTLGLALQAAFPGFGNRAVQMRHFAIAAVLAYEVSGRRLAHLHNHATDASCTVAMLAAALGDFHFSFTVHGPQTFFAPAARRLDVKLRRALFVRCTSYFCRSQCLMWAPTDRWAHLHVVHCGVDPECYPVRDHCGPGSHLLFVGRLVAAKGLPILVDALARLRAQRPAIRLTIVGAGQEGAGIEARVRAEGLGNHVRFTGYQTPEQVGEWLRLADVFVLPSLAEGVPVALMEAMVAGVPVVATSVGGLSELVEDGVTGFLVPAAAPGALAQRIEELLDDAGLRNRLGRAGRAKVVRDFNLALEVTRLRELFQWAADGQIGAPGLGHDAREVLRGYEVEPR
jgi:glycosyltransferase involved in cell wall biosynthesis